MADAAFAPADRPGRRRRLPRRNQGVQVAITCAFPGRRQHSGCVWPERKAATPTNGTKLRTSWIDALMVTAAIGAIGGRHTLVSGAVLQAAVFLDYICRCSAPATCIEPPAFAYRLTAGIPWVASGFNLLGFRTTARLTRGRIKTWRLDPSRARRRLKEANKHHSCDAQRHGEYFAHGITVVL